MIETIMLLHGSKTPVVGYAATEVEIQKRVRYYNNKKEEVIKLCAKYEESPEGSESKKSAGKRLKDIRESLENELY